MTDDITSARALRAWQEYMRKLQAWRKIKAAVAGHPDAIKRITEALKCS